VIESVPTGSAVVVKLAVPLFSVPAPKRIGPYMKVTVSPSGGVPALPTTVAVKVTLCPGTEGFCEEVSVVVVVVMDAGSASLKTVPQPVTSPPSPRGAVQAVLPPPVPPNRFPCTSWKTPLGE
jgi:hypothetical protein